MKTQDCTPGEARRRLLAAHKFLEAAELFLDDPDPEGRRVAVSNAVHAGIAAADAICCVRLGRHAVGDDHRSATELVRKTGPGGADAARALTTLLGLKSKAQYQIGVIGRTDATSAVRRARSLVEHADKVVFAAS